MNFSSRNNLYRMNFLGLTCEKVSRERSSNRVGLATSGYDAANKSLGGSMPLDIDRSLCARHMYLGPAF